MQTAIKRGVALLPKLRLEYEQMVTACYCAGQMEADIARQYLARHGKRLKIIIKALEAMKDQE